MEFLKVDKNKNKGKKEDEDKKDRSNQTTMNFDEEKINFNVSRKDIRILLAMFNFFFSSYQAELEPHFDTDEINTLYYKVLGYASKYGMVPK